MILALSLMYQTSSAYRIFGIGTSTGALIRSGSEWCNGCAPIVADGNHQSASLAD